MIFDVNFNAIRVSAKASVIRRSDRRAHNGREGYATRGRLAPWKTSLAGPVGNGSRAVVTPQELLTACTECADEPTSNGTVYRLLTACDPVLL